MFCPALHYLMREWGGKLFRLLQHLAYFGCACVMLLHHLIFPPLLSAALSEGHVTVSYVRQFWSRPWKKYWFVDCRYAQVCLSTCCIISKVLSTARKKSQCDPCFSLSPAQFSCQWNRGTSPSLTPRLHRSDSITVESLFPSADSCWSLWPLNSLWHHVNGHSLLSVLLWFLWF